MDTDTIADVAGIVSSVVTTFATVLAGGWAYYRFLKGRVFKSRLTLVLTASQIRVQGTAYVLSVIEIANVGLSSVDLSNGTLRFRALTGKSGEDSAAVPGSTWLETSNVLLAHTWIESAETLAEQHLLILPATHRVPVQVDLRVVSRGVSFSASAIAMPSGDP